MATELAKARADEERQRWQWRMEQQAETAAQAEKALATALEAKAAAELEATYAREEVEELKGELLVHRSSSSSGGGGGGGSGGASAGFGGASTALSTATPRDTARSVASRGPSAISSMPSSAARQNTRGGKERHHRRRAALLGTQADQAAPAGPTSPDGDTPTAPPAAHPAHLVQPQLPPPSTAESRLEQAQHAYAPENAPHALDPPRVVVRRRPGSAPAVRRRPSSATTASAAGSTRRKHAVAGRVGGDSSGGRRIKGRQAVLQPPLLAPRSMNSSATGTQSAVAVGLSRPRRGEQQQPPSTARFLAFCRASSGFREQAAARAGAALGDARAAEKGNVDTSVASSGGVRD